MKYGVIFGAACAAIVVATAAAFAGVPATLKRLPPLLPGVAALPRLVAPPGDRAAGRIDRALAGADAQEAALASGCGRHDGWSRTVRVTMRGPRYLSLLAHDDFYCGGPYPDDGSTPFVYDLATGARVDWQRLLPAALVEKTIDYNEPGEGLIVSAALTALYVPGSTNDADCRDTLTHWEGGLGFMLWPDAAADGIAIEPDNLPHVVKACGPDVVIGLAALRKLGVDPALLDAIDEAHRMGWYATAGQKP